MTASWIRMPILALAATGAIAASAVAFAQAPPNPPSRFAGSVTINGAPAPAGASIQAKVGAANCGSAAVFIEAGQSRYVVDVPAADGTNAGCGTDGATVTFLVNGVQAAQTGQWANFKLSDLNLTVGGAATATATATTTGTAAATSTPRPPTTGSGTEGGAETSWLLLTVLGGVALGAGATAAAVTRRK